MRNQRRGKRAKQTKNLKALAAYKAAELCKSNRPPLEDFKEEKNTFPVTIAAAADIIVSG